MSVDCFLDSNVLVYLFDPTDEKKRQRAEQLIQQTLALGTACISYQVVQETIKIFIGLFQHTLAVVRIDHQRYPQNSQ